MSHFLAGFGGLSSFSAQSEHLYELPNRYVCVGFIIDQHLFCGPAQVLTVRGILFCYNAIVLSFHFAKEKFFMMLYCVCEHCRFQVTGMQGEDIPGS